MVTPPALEVPRVPQRTAAQVAAEMAQVQAARQRATQAERAALRARADDEGILMKYNEAVDVAKIKAKIDATRAA